MNTRPQSTTAVMKNAESTVVVVQKKCIKRNAIIIVAIIVQMLKDLVVVLQLVGETDCPSNNSRITITSPRHIITHLC